jgi:glutamate/tyrosine decarboxylase-like PLP-dependent enzyme
MDLPQHGRAADDVIAELKAKRVDDARWQDGKTFGLVFDGGPSVHEVAERAALMYLHENALNPMAFPSLGQIQDEVVAWTAALLHGPDTAAGFLTSGGTESIQCAVLAARERGRAERGIEFGEIVVAESAHAAFHKSSHMYGMPIHTTPVADDWTADVAAMAEAVCMGGFVLPFVEMLGRPVPTWDFRVEGVHSISADIHKLGYAPKGVSVVVYRDKRLRRHQTFLFDGWLGGFYGSPNLQGTRSGLPMAAAWAVMQHLGVDGYVELTGKVLETADRFRAGIDAIDGLRLLGDGGYHLVAMSSDPAADDPIDVFALGDALAQRDWYLDRQGPPDSLHATVSNGNAAVIDQFLADLQSCVGEVRGHETDDRSTTYSAIE